VIGVDISPFCIPLIVDSWGEVEKTVQAHGHEVRYIEVWLDYLRDRSRERIASCSKDNPGRFVFHFRRRNLDPIETPLAERRRFLTALAPLDVFIDLDHASQREEIHFIRRLSPHATGIVSFHNYTSTPPLPELRRIARQLHIDWPEAIVKLSTLCNSDADAEAIIRLERELTDEAIPHIVLGMGEHGRITRIAGARGGNVMNFVPVTGQLSSAPGQIPLAELRTILAADSMV
jgi:3-dehydroquinate dehydratase type I